MSSGMLQELSILISNTDNFCINFEFFTMPILFVLLLLLLLLIIYHIFLFIFCQKISVRLSINRTPKSDVP